jgi:hypothetical protein
MYRKSGYQRNLSMPFSLGIPNIVRSFLTVTLTLKKDLLASVAQHINI